MNKKLHFKTVILGASILLAFAYVGGHLIAQERLEDLKNELLVQVSKQQALLTTIAETTARNGADDVTEKIVKDCSIDERTQFDSLLGRLDAGLPQTDLVTLERLFGRCGTFYAERKSVMVARFEREVEVYEHYVTQLSHISAAGNQDFNVPLWKQLVEDEKKQSAEFTALVENQDKIISALLSGKSAASPEIKTILTEVKRIQQSLTDTSISAGEKRRLLDAL